MNDKRQNRLRRSGRLFLLLWIGSATTAAAQERVTLDFTGAQKLLVDIDLARIPSMLSGLPPAPREDPAVMEVIKSAEGAAHRALRISLGRLRGAAVQTRGGEDVLLASWSVTGSDGAETLAVWDTPGFTVFLLLWRGAPFHDAESARSFSENIIQWKSLSSLMRLPIRWDGAARTVVGLSPTILASVRIGYELQILGQPLGESYVYAVVFGKLLVEAAYPRGQVGDHQSDYVFVPERFPPLRDRIRGWSNDAIVAALDDGNGVRADHRDQILLSELLKRNPAESLVRALFDAPGPFRVNHVMLALALAKAKGKYSAVLRDVLLSQSPGLHKSEETVRVILGGLASDDTVDLCDLAANNLAHGRFVRPSLYYLGERGYTQAHLESIKRAVLPDPTVQGSRDAAINRFETRGHPAR